MRATIRFLVTVAVLVLSALSLSQVLAQQTQASYAVNLSSFTLQVTYPSEVMPRENITVNVQASPKTTGTYLQTLAATVYYGDTSGLHTITTQPLLTTPGMLTGHTALEVSARAPTQLKQPITTPSRSQPTPHPIQEILKSQLDPKAEKHPKTTKILRGP
jgi:hypothetical protein